MGDVPGVIDFPGDNSTNQAYFYDANGNLIRDLNKGMNTDIVYNFMNKPELLDFGSGEKIKYLYDGSGNKLAKEVIDNNAIGASSLLYAGNFVYDWNGTLKYIITPDGRIVNDDNYYRIEYYMQDHLGNTRATYAAACPGVPQVAEYQHYYPFGMQLEALCYSSGADLPNNYLYNGKELQPEYGLQWYDYGWRQFDPQIGRFTTQDRFSEKYFSLSNYQYAANNPIRFLDVNGDSIFATQAFIKNEKIDSAMKAILATKAAHAYISKYAAKGDKLFGFEFKDEGEYSKKGIDLNFKLSELTYYSGLTGTKESKDKKGFDVTIQIDPAGDYMSSFDVAETIIHECLLEADLQAKDVQDGKRDDSNISSYVKNDWLKKQRQYWGHGQNYMQRKQYGGENLLWPGTGYRILQDVNKSLNTKLTNQQIQNKMKYPYFEGQLFGKF
jgi:RHS repeat-associated protein